MNEMMWSILYDVNEEYSTEYKSVHYLSLSLSMDMICKSSESVYALVAWLGLNCHAFLRVLCSLPWKLKLTSYTFSLLIDLANDILNNLCSEHQC